MFRPHGKRRAILVEDDGGRVPFDFVEVENWVTDLVSAARSSTISDRERAKQIIAYLTETVASIKLTTKYKPWKHQASPGNDGVPDSSAYRKGFYDGWAHLQNVLRTQILGEPPR